MKNKIYVHIGAHLGLMVATNIPVEPGEKEYISKDALLEWANGMCKASVTLGEEISYKELIEHIKSL